MNPHNRTEQSSARVLISPSMRRPFDVKAHFFFLLSVSLFPLSEAAPSPSFHPHSFVSDSRSVQVGRTRFSRCCYLIIDLCSHLFGESGPRT